MDQTERLQARYRQFCADRDWGQFHTPKNLAMALAGEVGELVALLQWMTGEESQALAEDPDVLQAVGEEVADIQLYLWRFAEQAGIDVSGAVDRKLSVNDAKYPVDKARSRSTKYDKL